MNLKKLSQIQGFSLVEVLIASGLMALVSAGLVSMITTMGKEQSNQFRTATFRELKTRIQYLITDQNSWARILEKNATGLAPYNSMLCIKNKTDCAAGVYDLQLYDSFGSLFLDAPRYNLNTPLWPGNSNGFNDKGVGCSTFNGNQNAGLETCPITYKIVWEPVCPAVGCKNPLIKITARMFYNSSNAAKVAAMSQGNVTGLGAWTDDSVAANTGKYDVMLRRSATTINKSFTIAITNNAGAATPGGSCSLSAGSPSARGSSGGPAWVETDDNFDLVSVISGSPSIIIKAGTYSCKIVSLAYSVDNFYIKLVQTAPTLVNPVPGSAATGNAPTKLQAVAVSNPILSLTENSTFQLVQWCQTSDPISPNYAMGMPAGYPSYSTISTYASITCTQTN